MCNEERTNRNDSSAKKYREAREYIEKSIRSINMEIYRLCKEIFKSQEEEPSDEKKRLIQMIGNFRIGISDVDELKLQYGTIKLKCVPVSREESEDFIYDINFFEFCLMTELEELNLFEKETDLAVDFHHLRKSIREFASFSEKS